MEVRDVRYVTSQPWPFPGSLMLGFETAWAGGDARVADAELDDVRWFDAAELEAARREEGPYGLPPREAIARRLIEGWLARRRAAAAGPRGAPAADPPAGRAAAPGAGRRADARRDGGGG